MAKTKTSSTVKNRYNAKAYDQLPIRVPKGKKDVLTVHAQSQGKSLNGFVNEAIDEKLERDIESTINFTKAVDRIGALNPQAKAIILEGKSGMSTDEIAVLVDSSQSKLTKAVKVIIERDNQTAEA
jgi:hypothetical protein